MTASPDERACLIVNADDYGYFRCISKGILKSATHGVVTATGVFANTIHFGEHAAWLRDCDALDTGVHWQHVQPGPRVRRQRTWQSMPGGRLLPAARVGHGSR